jgi:predicted Ser/Thr protein kinase
MALWVAVVVYTVAVLGAALYVPFARILDFQVYQTMLGLPTYLLSVFGLGVDLLLLGGFWVIGGMLFVRRSDDWMAILTSLMMFTFGMRITSLAYDIGQTPGFQFPVGLILTLGDIGIVLFLMLFPDGKFAPHWLRFSVPLLVLSMGFIYLVPNQPFHWINTNTGPYMAATVFWYLVASFSCVYRYARQAYQPHQRQQIRWVFLGALGPFVWYLVFQSLWMFVPSLTDGSMTSIIVDITSRFLSIFMFLIFPLTIVISIARYKSFDIDLLINRSLVYGVLTIGLVLTFAAALGVVSLVFRNIQQGDQSLMALTVSAVAVGALFQPARKKLQRFIDHVFFKIRIDYQKTPAQLRAESVTDGGSITPSLSAYRGLELIGRGGMAEVYRGEDPTTGQAIAIKVLLANLAEDDQFRRRFIREAEAITRLTHPNIVHILSYGDENGIYFIVMDYLTGPALNELLKQQKQMTLAETVALLRDIASALDYAHQKGLVHRDIKPSNVVLDSERYPPRAVLTDFGIAKIADAHTRITATNILGTFDYIAPEQIQAAPDLDGRADIYALGVMTFQLLTGQLPFKRSDTGALLLAHMTAPPPDARDLLPDLPRQAARAIQKAMAKKPDERFATAAEFVAALSGA